MNGTEKNEKIECDRMGKIGLVGTDFIVIDKASIYQFTFVDYFSLKITIIQTWIFCKCNSNSNNKQNSQSSTNGWLFFRGVRVSSDEIGQMWRCKKPNWP